MRYVANNRNCTGLLTSLYNKYSGLIIQGHKRKVKIDVYIASTAPVLESMKCSKSSGTDKMEIRSGINEHDKNHNKNIH